MKAVNLIPADERRGAGGAAGRTGGAAYILVGALALIVAMLVAYATTTKSVDDERAKLAKVEQEAAATEARAATLAPYTAFAALRVARVATVQSIADSRFDWAHAMRELGRTLPKDITLTALNGSVSAKTGSGGAVALRATYDVPAVEVNGCAPGQASIPPMLASLRRVDGVRRVALQQSVKEAGGASGGTGPDGKEVQAPDCRRTFQAVVFFDPRPTPAVADTAVPAATVPPTGTAENGNGGTK